ncbi:hypothetical protein ACN2WE_41485 (plasmid) [Streptomyces sp. cg28]|uniref:Uncharacterized protein n=1 Tax=Streptomyces tabacisoli TaxID=3156398 RepID=A0AAU8J5C3_9ACTN
MSENEMINRAADGWDGEIAASVSADWDGEIAANVSADWDGEIAANVSADWDGEALLDEDLLNAQRNLEAAANDDGLIAE